MPEFDSTLSIPACFSAQISDTTVTSRTPMITGELRPQTSRLAEIDHQILVLAAKQEEWHWRRKVASSTRVSARQQRAGDTVHRACGAGLSSLRPWTLGTACSALGGTTGACRLSAVYTVWYYSKSRRVLQRVVTASGGAI